MNSEVESSRLKTTRTGTHVHVQAITPPSYVHTGRKNSRVVAHDHEPFTASPAEQGLDSDVIR